MSKELVHGTTTAYFKHKYKCGDCRAVGTAHSRSYRERRRDPVLYGTPLGLLHDYPEGAFTGSLTVTCWCERKQAQIDPDDIRMGYTFSCGWEGCSDLAVSTWEAWIERLLREATGRQRATTRAVNRGIPVIRRHRRTVQFVTVPCWCERKVGPLHVAELRAGRTWSCGIGCSRFTWQRHHAQLA